MTLTLISGGWWWHGGGGWSHGWNYNAFTHAAAGVRAAAALASFVVLRLGAALLRDSLADCKDATNQA